MTDFFKQFHVPFARAICYSGYRNGQQPGGVTPSYEEIKEDLLLLQSHWRYLRLYDCDEHAATVIQVIQQEGLNFKIMLGAYIVAEMNNHGCPWQGGVYEEAQLEENKKTNEEKIQRLIRWANEFPEIIFTVSLGNEACVDWTDHFVPVERVIEFAKQVKQSVKQPVTFCENYVPWLNYLAPLVQHLDFISIHTYPVWEYKHIHESVSYTMSNYQTVASCFPDVPVVITEAGWATNSHGKGIHTEHVNEINQKIYFDDLMAWTTQNNILTFFFEAFDEQWKGSSDPMEPEKHWGVFRADRTPKLVMEAIKETAQ